MEGQMKGPTAPERPQIPDILIEATVRAIKAGMKPDEFSKAVATQTADENTDAESTVATKSVRGKKGNKHEERFKNSAAGHRKIQTEDEEDEAEPERTYRSFDERRMGFLIIGDQHRFGGKFGADKFIFPNSAPLDFSFCMISRIEEILTEGEQPQTTRNYRTPYKTHDERYQTSSVRLSYNVIDTMDGLINVLYKILDGGPFGLCWLDLSFNAITKLDDDTLSQLTNLKILYLHGNAIGDMTEIPKLQTLSNLRTLTLHGNPVEQEDGYRIAVLYYLPYLLHLDYIAVTKSDKANAIQFGSHYEKYWKNRHADYLLTDVAKSKAAEISYTEKIMNVGDDSDDDDDFMMLRA